MRRLSSIVLIACVALVSSACGGGPAPSAVEDGGGLHMPDGGSPAETANAGWIGGACQGTADCAYEGAICLTEDAGFPRGTCSLRCERTCPDRDGGSITFCVADESGAGTCVSRCDRALFPQTGCRTGYGCVAVARKGEPDRTEEVCLPQDASGAAHPLNDLQPALERAAKAAGIDGERVALFDLTRPERPVIAALRPSEPVYPASIIKVVVMAEVERQIEAGQLSLDTTFTVTAEQDTCDSVPSSDVRPRLVAGDVVRVELLEDLMITRSDNTATNVLIDNVGRQNATAYMDALGLSTLRVYRKVFGCAPYDDSGWDGVHLNTMTALETAKLYRLILEGGDGFVGEAGRTRMQQVLGRQLWRGSIAAGLPSDAVFLSKTGDTSQVVHDSGIIFWRGRRYIVAAFLEMSPATGRPKLQEFGHQLHHLMESRAP